MAVTSYMNIFGHEFSEGANAKHGIVSITYNVKDCAPRCVARVAFDLDDSGLNVVFTIKDHGRKVRNTNADRERAGYILETARRWYYTTYGITAFE